MDKLDQLFIRACKSSTPTVRVYSVYRRFYAVDPSSGHICDVLIQICEKYIKIGLSDLIDRLNPANSWRLGIEDSDSEHSYHKRVIAVLISKIRLKEVAVFEGLTTPRMLRDSE